MPFYDDCDASPFLSASECLDFMEQMMTVSRDPDADTRWFNINLDNGLLASQSHCSLGWSQISVFTITLIINVGYFSWKYSYESSRDSPKGSIHRRLAPSWIPLNFSCAILSDGLWMFCPLHTQLSHPWWRGQTIPYRTSTMRSWNAWFKKVQPFFSGRLYGGASFLCIFRCAFVIFILECSILIDSAARILFQPSLAPWSFCKIWHPSTLQVEYLLPWHLIGWKSWGLRRLSRCYHRSDGLLF